MKTGGASLKESAAIAGLIIAAISACYFPGLNSLFLFDDTPNLNALMYIRDFPWFSEPFFEFVLGGEAGPTGRPLSLFTFALQAGSWPDSPLPFKVVNLVLHIMSALLVYLITRCLLTILNTDKPSSWPALLISLAWALHPMHSSTVLYTVQRMALLSNLFMLLAIYCYIRARLILGENTSITALLKITAVLGLIGLLALLSKENAPSLVFYLLTLEYTLLHRLPADRLFQRWRQTVLWFPAILVVLLPLVFFSSLQQGFSDSFTFGPAKRLLTELRILWIYLFNLFLPTTSALGIFHDINVSTGLFQPVTTVLSLLGWLAAFLAALIRQQSNRLVLFALLWFLSGHLIESTILPLELFFHHRNYLASYGIIFVLGYTLFRLSPPVFRKPYLLTVICSLYLALMAFNTARISVYWSNSLALAERWYTGDPGTQRNAEFFAIELAALGPEGEQAAAGIFQQTINNSEEPFRLTLNLMTLACVNAAITSPDPGLVLAMADNISPEERDLVGPVQQLVTLSIQGNCQAFDSAFFHRLLTSLTADSDNPNKGMYFFELARLEQHQGNSLRSLALLDEARQFSDDPGILITQALQLSAAGRTDEAVGLLDEARQAILDHNDIRTGSRTSKLNTLAALRNQLGSNTSEQ